MHVLSDMMMKISNCCLPLRHIEKRWCDFALLYQVKLALSKLIFFFFLIYLERIYALYNKHFWVWATLCGLYGSCYFIWFIWDYSSVKFYPFLPGKSNLLYLFPLNDTWVLFSYVWVFGCQRLANKYSQCIFVCLLINYLVLLWWS